MTNRKKPGVAFWATLVVVVLVLYVLSIGPACRVYDEMSALPALKWTEYPLGWFYRPLLWAWKNSETADDFFDWYIAFWLPGSR